MRVRLVSGTLVIPMFGSKAEFHENKKPEELLRFLSSESVTLDGREISFFEYIENQYWDGFNWDDDWKPLFDGPGTLITDASQKIRNVRVRRYGSYGYSYGGVDYACWEYLVSGLLEKWPNLRITIKED